MFLLWLFAGVIIGVMAGFFLSALLGAGADDRAELDDLKRNTIPKLQYSLERANKYGIAADKENQQLRAEIERLQKYNTDVAFKHYNDGINDFAAKVKKEAAAMACSPDVTYLSDYYVYIDNLIKEMRAKGEKDNESFMPKS